MKKQKHYLREETGVRVLRLVSTAAGGMIDFQYQIADPDKALVLHDDANPPMIVSDKAQWTISRTLHEHGFEVQQTGLTYHILIINEGGKIQQGDKVTLEIGDAKLENIVIE